MGLIKKSSLHRILLQREEAQVASGLFEGGTGFSGESQIGSEGE
jgi:hypothetical protein